LKPVAKLDLLQQCASIKCIRVISTHVSDAGWNVDTEQRSAFIKCVQSNCLKTLAQIGLLQQLASPKSHIANGGDIGQGIHTKQRCAAPECGSHPNQFESPQKLDLHQIRAVLECLGQDGPHQRVDENAGGVPRNDNGRQHGEQWGAHHGGKTVEEGGRGQRGAVG
jgi:hypothetical protein